ncbi:MAG: flavin reductase family protein [Verrucomicrobiales bacterium]
MTQLPRLSFGNNAAYRKGMRLDLEGQHAEQAYKILTGLVTPRPIALVTTQGDDGRVNAAPFSFFNVFGSSPPIVAFAPGDRDPEVPKDTARNIRKNHEFVVNLVDEPIAERMVKCAASLDYGISELEHVGLTTVASERVKPPRIAEAPASLECREWGTLQIGDNRLVIGTVSLVHVRNGILDPEHLYVERDAYSVVGRMHGPDGYIKTSDFFRIERPD